MTEEMPADVFAAHRPGEPPYHLREFDQAEADRHLALIRRAEELGRAETESIP